MDLKEQYDKLLRYCYMKTKDRTTSEDIVQDTFLRFWQGKSYEDTGKEMAYLYTVARNLCMDEFRKRKTIGVENCSDFTASKNYEPETVIERLAIEEALEKLPKDLREIVVLRYISEMSCADIGKVMHLSRFSVNRRLKEGTSLIKKYMEGDRDDR